MLVDAFLPNLALFAAGQAAAWHYLRTGRFWIGAFATAALWALADWFFVAKYVYGVGRPELAPVLHALQAVALLTVVALGFALWRRRWSAAARRRPQAFAAGMAAYLRDDLGAAEATFVRLVRTDPWDAAAWLALGNVHRQAGRPRRAQRCYRRAIAVDRRRIYGDFGKQQLARGLAAPGAVEPPPVAAPVVRADTTAPTATP